MGAIVLVGAIGVGGERLVLWKRLVIVERYRIGIGIGISMGG